MKLCTTALPTNVQGSNYTTTTVHNGQEFHTVVLSLITGISQSPGWWRDCPALQEEEGQVQGACLWTLPGMLFIGQSTLEYFCSFE